MDDREAFLIAFAVFVALLYFKALVRVDPRQMFASIVSTVPLSAVLFEYTGDSPFVARALVLGLGCAFALTGARSAVRQERMLRREHLSVLEEMIRPGGPTGYKEWCKSTNPLTVGLCFLPEDYRIQTIEFIRSHTTPGDPLYSGLMRHDKAYANNMLIYFATERLPMTKWAHFDPGLQNSLAIQGEMVREFEGKRPAYIVLSWETDFINEPNDSSKSSGVTLLDDYIHKEYERVATFGGLSVWARNGLTPSF